MLNKIILKKILNNIIKILAYFNLVILITTLILYMLMNISYFKVAQKVSENTKLNYDISISYPEYKNFVFDIEKFKKEFNINSYATLNIDQGLIIKSDKINFKANIINIIDNNLNLFNTDTLKENRANISKNIARSYNLNDEDNIFIKSNILNDRAFNLNTSFKLKHPLFINTDSVFILDNKKDNQNIKAQENIKNSEINNASYNLIYINIPNENKEELNKKIKEYVKSINPNLNIYENTYESSKKIAPIFKKTLIIQLVIFLITGIIIKFVNIKMYENEYKYIKNNKKEHRKKDKIENKISYKLIKISINIINIIFISYLGYLIYEIFVTNYIYKFGLYIPLNSNYINISVLVTTIFIIINSLINKCIKNKIDQKYIIENQ